MKVGQKFQKIAQRLEFCTEFKVTTKISCDILIFDLLDLIFVDGLEVSITDTAEAILVTHPNGDVVLPVAIIREQVIKKKDLVVAVFPRFEIIGW